MSAPHKKAAFVFSFGVRYYSAAFVSLFILLFLCFFLWSAALFRRFCFFVSPMERGAIPPLLFLVF